MSRLDPFAGPSIERGGTMSVRAESTDGHAAVRQVNEQAFGRGGGKLPAEEGAGDCDGATIA